MIYNMLMFLFLLFLLSLNTNIHFLFFMRRVWSIDYSLADPTMLASGDDCSVKLWSINQAILFLHLVDVSFETKRIAVI